MKRLVLLCALIQFSSTAALADTPSNIPAFGVYTATTVTVTSTSDVVADDGVCILREAIIAANTDTASGLIAGECPAGSGADVISLSAATYTFIDGPYIADGENALPDITSDITINGNGAIIERSSAGGTPTFRLFHVAAGGSLTLDDVAIQNGATASGGYGGGIYALGSLTVQNGSIIRNNTSDFGGGGIYIDDADLKITDPGTVIGPGNSGFNGGGIYYLNGIGNTGSIENGAAVISNTASYGAGVRLLASNLVVDNAIIGGA
ncbi:MAG: hypothetical protein HY326_06085 [Chloroflexi bacterium]|nr:hypothetical protein [Chloroflexota bacterium]